MEGFKVLLVGSHQVGKTAFSIKNLDANINIEEYLPRIAEQYSQTVNVNNKSYTLHWWDTHEDEDWSRFVFLSYPQTNVALLLYSMVEETSFDQIVDKFYPGVVHHLPGIPVILVATKLDLIDDPKTIEKLASKGRKPVSHSRGIELAKHIGAYGYIAISSYTNSYLDTIPILITNALDGYRISKKKEVGYFQKMKNMLFVEKPKYQYFYLDKNVGRTGHTCHQYLNKLYFFGGITEKGISEEILVLDSRNFDILDFLIKERNLWEVPIPSGYKRYDHASVIVGDNVYFFGGKPNFMNDMVVYNITNNTWVVMETSGKKPTGRYGCTLVSYKEKLYMYGGYDNYVQACSEIFEFDLATKTWSQLQVEEPTPRNYHSAVVIQGKMFVFGGVSQKGTLNDLITFDFKTLSWTQHKLKGPKPRYGHSAFAIGNGMYIFGGQDGDKDIVYNELWLLNTSVMEWDEIKTKTLPIPRNHHTSVATEGGVYTFGGRGVEVEGIQRKILNELIVFRLGKSQFEQLPVELLYLIIENLDDYSMQVLAMTSKYMRKEVKKKRGTDFRCWWNPDWKLTGEL